MGDFGVAERDAAGDAAGADADVFAAAPRRLARLAQGRVDFMGNAREMEKTHGKTMVR